MKIGIVGWGVEGQSAFKYFGPEHTYLIVNEQPSPELPQESEKIKLQFLNGEKPPGITGNVEDLSYLEGLENCDRIIYTPTSYKNLRKQFGDNPGFWDKATTALQLFFENVNTKNLIGVTGTKGKGTTSTLIYKILEASSKKVYLVGNIGKSVLDIVNEVQPEDFVVLELSSFQLHEFPYSPHIAVCLLIEPEHLDWHANTTEYIEAKSNIFAHQAEDDIAIYFADNKYSKQIASYSKGKKIPYYQKPGAHIRDDGMIVIGDNETEIIDKDDVKLLGRHNLQNVCAAITAVWQVDQNIEAINEVLKNFKGLEHRLEFVREIDGIKFYNDSFASAPPAPLAALHAINGKKVMIVGGFDRGLDLKPLAKGFAENQADLERVLVIGAIRQRLGEAFNKAGFTNYELVEDKDIKNIVEKAFAKAKNGNSVVLSPGCASFDMFKNFEVRGLEYKAAVNEL